MILFGGPQALFGWLFGGFGMIFAVLFLGSADFASAIYFHGPLDTVTGKLTECVKTHSSEGGSKHSSGTPIYAFHYQFYANGNTYTNISYQTGRALNAPDSVTVEFPAGHPEHSRIRGMRCAVFGPEVSFVLIFPAIGLGVAGYSLLAGIKRVSLLRNGEIASARVSSKETTNMRVNRKTVYKVWFDFVDRTGSYQKASCRTTIPEEYEDGGFKYVFYDAANPTRSILLASISGTVTLNERGEIDAASTGKALRALAPVSAAIACTIGAFFLLHLMGT